MNTPASSNLPEDNIPSASIFIRKPEKAITPSEVIYNQYRH